MSKKLKKLHAKDHLGDIKMSFLAAMISGIDKKLSTPKGTIMFSRLDNAKKNEQFRSHIMDVYAKRSAKTLDFIEREDVFAAATKHQKKYAAAVKKHVDKIEKQGSDFNHHELLANTFDALEKVHAQLVDNL